MAEKMARNNPWYRDEDESIREVKDGETGKKEGLFEFD